MSGFLNLFPIFCLATGALAWGQLGHHAVGFVAMEFLAPQALSFVQQTLGDEYNHSLGPAASWADTVREKGAYRFTEPFHFIDANDSPLQNRCSVDDSRDCGPKGCLLTAITNYTQRMVDKTLPADQIEEALKFVTHFLGDIGQPLHVEAMERGGNEIKALCGGRHTNLHAIWDTGMIEKHLKSSFDDSVENWAQSLAKEIKSGQYQSNSSEWISCSNTTSTLSSRGLEFFRLRSLREEMLELISTRDYTSVTPLACPLVWAKEANAFDCTHVFGFKDGENLCEGSYFDGAMPIIDMQIAKQGFRLAAWLNAAFNGSTSSP